MVVRELLTRLGFQLNQAQINRAEQATNRIRDRADMAAQSFRNIALAIASFSTVKSIVAIGDEMQSLRSQVGLLPQVVGDAGDAVDLLVDKANAARQSIANYGSFFVKAGNATKDFITDQAELLRVVDGAAIGIAASGASAANQGQAFYQLGQAIGSPVVQMEEMNTLIDAAPDLFRELGRVIPGANNNLKKFIGTGAVTGKMLAEALQKVAVVFEDRMLKMPMTVGQAMIIVNNKFSRMIDRMNRESMFITKIANVIIKGFNAVEGGILKTIKAFGGFNTVIRLIATAIAVSLIPQMVKLATVSALPVLHWLAIAAAIFLATLAIEDFYTWTQGGESIIGDMIGPWKEWSGFVLGTLNFIKTGLRQIGELAATVGALIVGAFTLDFSLIKEAMRGFGNLMTKGAINPEGQKLWYQQPSVNQQSMSGNKSNLITNNTTVNLTVPPGTPQEQANFLVKASEKYFGSKDKYPSATDMAVLAP